MLINRDSWRIHWLPATLSFATLLVLVGWYGAASWAAGGWLRGSSLPALVMGIVATLIILFEMALWPRKALRRFRLVPTKYWLAAHLWFGLICLPLGVVHSGFHWGGWLSTLLLVSLILTVVSGGIGLLLQQWVPRTMLRQLPLETIHSEIDRVSRVAAEDMEALLCTAYGARDIVMTELWDLKLSRFQELLQIPDNKELTQVIRVGAPRDDLRRRDFQHDREEPLPQDDARSLWNAYDELKPFLLDGVSRGAIFGEQSRASGWFNLLRLACSADAEKVIKTLEQLTEQRRQFNRQRRLHRWLHSWLPVHIGLSVALCMMLFAHIVFALRYW